MSGVSASVSGSFSKTERFLQSMQKLKLRQIVEPTVQSGVSALAAATPRETGRTAQSWSYEIEEKPGHLTIWWTNNDIENGFSVAMGIQHGHGTGTGGYVQGRDYINPAMRPIFDKIVSEVWRVVTSA